MTDERRPPAQAQPDDTAAVAPERPVRIVVSQDERGESRLEVVEATFEQSYHLRDAYSTTLFLAHFRGKGHLPYRRARSATPPSTCAPRSRRTRGCGRAFSSWTAF